MNNLEQKIIERKAKISVIGIGYVGLPLAVCFANEGFNVIAYDIDEKKISIVNQGTNPLSEERWLTPKLEEVVSNGRLSASGNLSSSGDADIIIISVPTPAVGRNHMADYSYVISAVTNLSKSFRKGSLISLESTVGPGTTRGLVSKIIRDKTGLQSPYDFGLVFSPERIDPGNQTYNVTNIPKVVGGLTKRDSEIGALLYQQINPEIIEVKSPEEAELTKLLENVYRDVNIALANEFAIFFEDFYYDNYIDLIRHGFDNSLGFTHYPGLVGGHCIPHDPWFLVDSLRGNGVELTLTKTARLVNQMVPDHVFARIKDMLESQGKTIGGSKITVLGFAYKENIPDTRSSPGIKIADLFSSEGASIQAYDPYVSDAKGFDLSSSLEDSLTGADVVVLVTAHNQFLSDLAPALRDQSRVVFYDVRNGFGPEISDNGMVYGGLGRNYLCSQHLNMQTDPVVRFLGCAIRYVNIALAREFEYACQAVGHSDINSVIWAASTKPFGYSPIYPDEQLCQEEIQLLQEFDNDPTHRFRLIEAANKYFV